MINLDCFKAYDVRGKVPQELNSLLSYNIAVAYSKIIKPKKVVIGYDVRLSSPLLQEYFIRGLISSGVSVVDIKLCGTEEVYYHCFFFFILDEGIMNSDSHNPADYNGIKMVGRAAKPISLDSELSLIRDYILLNWIDKKYDPSSNQELIETCGKLKNLEPKDLDNALNASSEAALGIKFEDSYSIYERIKKGNKADLAKLDTALYEHILDKCGY